MSSDDLDKLLVDLERKAELIAEQIRLTQRLRELQDKHEKIPSKYDTKNRRSPKPWLMISDKQALANIAANLVRLMHESSLSYSELARRCTTEEHKCYPGGIERLSKGVNKPTAGFLARIAAALGVTPNDLLMSSELEKKK